MARRKLERLINLRQDKGFTQFDMAERMFISRSTYQRFERCEDRTTIDRLVDAAKVLDVPWTEIAPDE